MKEVGWVQSVQLARQAGCRGEAGGSGGGQELVGPQGGAVSHPITACGGEVRPGLPRSIHRPAITAFCAAVRALQQATDRPGPKTQLSVKVTKRLIP